MIDAIAGFFAVGAVGFFLYLTLLTIIFVASVENDKYAVAITFSIIAAIIWHKPLFTLLQHWEWLGIGALIYGASGAAYSVWRWFRLCREFIEQHPGETESRYRSHLAVSNYKSQLTGWIILWPFSLVWNVFGDFFKTIYESLRGVYTRVSESVIKSAMASRPPKAEKNVKEDDDNQFGGYR